MYLIFDTETTGLPKNFNAPITDTDNWPRCIQIAWQLHDDLGELIEHQDFLVTPKGFDIPYDAERIHGISTLLAQKEGIALDQTLKEFQKALEKAKFIVGQNVGFDVKIIGCEFHRLGIKNNLNQLPILDTCTEKTAQLCAIPGGKGGKFKLPNLTELHERLFNQKFQEAHNATADVEATTRCFFELIRIGNYSTEELKQEKDYLKSFTQKHRSPIEPLGLNHQNLKAISDKLRKELAKQTVDNQLSEAELQQNLENLKDVNFIHLHNHTQFSILQSTTKISDLVNLASKYEMPAVALTDHANMMGAFHFVSAVENYNKDNENPILPIIGCEFFICQDRNNKKQKDNGYQVVFLAKNKKGYENLCKMSSIGFVEGFYYVPRIDRSVVKKYKENLICLTGNLQGEVPNKILNIGEKQAQEALLWWKDIFQDDLYIEMMRHGQENEDRVNEVLIKFSKTYDIPIIATNNTYYSEKKDANAHDILLCVKDGEKQATPKGKGRGFRNGLDNEEYYFKSPQQMKELFKDVPDAIRNTEKLIEKIEAFKLKRDVLLPAFDIPQEFKDPKDLEDGGKRGENNFLKYLTFQGAKKRYDKVTPAIEERLNFELEVIEKTGYPGYFLIVEDFIREARKMDVSVGPGRGSAAGSAVAYCLWITNLDPIKYDLLFERFLNPDRISMPDIDIDFDDEGRSRVMDYVIDKYGANQVAQIITYGTMAAKSSIRDTARVLDLPLSEADRIAKLIPNTKLSKIFGKTPQQLAEKFRTY